MLTFLIGNKVHNYLKIPFEYSSVMHYNNIFVLRIGIL